LYDVKDYINRQRVEIWKVRNISNESAMADFMEKELKASEEEADALEEEILSNLSRPSPILKLRHTYDTTDDLLHKILLCA
jgi:hypothetical protein